MIIQYLKNRFTDYKMSFDKTCKNISDTTELYTDYEIYYNDLLVDAFSMSQKEIEDNFIYNLLSNLTEVLEINRAYLKFSHSSNDIIYVEVDFDKNNQWVKLEVKEIKNATETIFDGEHMKSSLDTDIYDPYKDGGWQNTPWFCIRCGSKLKAISKHDKRWGYLWACMDRNSSIYYLCSNQKCCHSDAPLLLFNSTGDYNSHPGDNYAIGWIK